MGLRCQFGAASAFGQTKFMTNQFPNIKTFLVHKILILLLVSFHLNPQVFPVEMFVCMLCIVYSDPGFMRLLFTPLTMSDMLK